MTSSPNAQLSEAEWLARARHYILSTRMDARSAHGPVLVRGEGSVVWDTEGRQYLDFNSGQMCAALGHQPHRVVEAIRQACDTLIHASSSILNVYEISLAERLAALTPYGLTRSLFLESGADANEAAVQLAKVHTGRTHVASPHVSFHGLSDSTRALTFGVRDWHRGYGPYAYGNHAIMAPYCYRCPIRRSFPECQLVCLDATFELLDAELDSPLAAVITEPLFSAGGVIEPPEGWLVALKRKCEERGALLILDEAQTGLGKLGTMWACEPAQVIPDILTISKHFGGGVSISAVVTTDEIADRAQAAGFVHGHSHTSDPLACAAAEASLETIVEEDLPGRAVSLGAEWRGRLESLARQHPVIGDIRGRGLIQGVELVRDRTTREPADGLGWEVERFCRQEGLLFSVRRAGTVLRFVPPWTTTTQQFERAAFILDAGLRASAPGPSTVGE